MPRARNPENRGFPTRWRIRSGSIYYQVPPGMEIHWDGKKEFPLGKTVTEAYRTWSARIGYMDRVRIVSQLLERYEREVIPTKAAKTAAENVRYCVNLRKVFGHMSLGSIQAQHIYQYVDSRSKKIESKDGKGKQTGGLSIAKREVAMFSHVFTMAVQWGYLGRHPFKGEVRLKGEKPRDRYVEDWELAECLALESRGGRGDAVKVVQAYLRLKLISGLRQSDLMRLRVADVHEDGIHVTPKKTENTTGKTLIITWNDDLRSAVRMVMDSRPVDISPWLFCTRKGLRYSENSKGAFSGWQSIWQRFIKRVLAETKIEERFTEHDIRAKTGSDMGTVEGARDLLGHSSSAITRKVYRRKAEKVTPLSTSE